MKLAHVNDLLEKAITVPGFYSKMVSTWDIVNATPADAIDLKHGKWEENTNSTHFCSECGYDAPYNIDGDEYTPLWCPHCGSKMDK